MKLVTTIKDLKVIISTFKNSGKKVGLVPTMGALHAGHCSLVNRSVKDNDITVVSDFVNPTQFNDKNDLDNYPHRLDADMQLLEECGADILFAPTVKEIYPKPDTRHFSFPPVDTVMEGPLRPGHFNGVCQIVSKLFMIVDPDRAYFGEKDFQQVAVIRAMVSAMHFPIEIIACPIVRESSGLALSSRNLLMSAEEKKNAVNISKILFESRIFATTHNLLETHKYVEDAISAVSGLRLEYFEIVNGNTLQKVKSWDETPYIVGCITVYSGKIRLIDNIKYRG